METPTLSRRTVTRGAAWSIPVITMAAASPAVAGSGVMVTTLSLPVGYIGETYIAPLAATGGSAPYTWTQTGTGIAPGTSVDPSGVIAGMPTRAGGFSATVTATASGGGSGSATLAQTIGADRATVRDVMLADLNARRASLGLAPLTVSSQQQSNATAWAEQLAATGSTLVHQDLGTIGANGENLSATCYSAAPALDPTTVGHALTNGWLTEKHGYAEYAALKATDPAAAEAMYHGTGAYAADGQSGHRINLENPAFTQVGLGMALSDDGSACGASYRYGYYGAADFLI